MARLSFMIFGVLWVLFAGAMLSIAPERALSFSLIAGVAGFSTLSVRHYFAPKWFPNSDPQKVTYAFLVLLVGVSALCDVIQYVTGVSWF